MESSFSSSPSSSLPNPPVGRIVYDAKGVPATISAVVEYEGKLQVHLLRENEQALVIPIRLLTLTDEEYHVRIAFDECLQGDISEGQDATSSVHEASHSIPVWEEVMEVEKKLVDSGKGVRVEKKVYERKENVTVSLLQEEIKVTRIPKQKILAPNEMPLPRQEGDTYIVPVFREVLVVEKRLCLEEEVHITKQKKSVESSQSIPLKSEHVSVQRFDEGTS